MHSCLLFPYQNKWANQWKFYLATYFATARSPEGKENLDNTILHSALKALWLWQHNFVYDSFACVSLNKANEKVQQKVTTSDLSQINSNRYGEKKLQSALCSMLLSIWAYTLSGHSAPGLTVVGNWPNTNHCGVHYINCCVCKVDLSPWIWYNQISTGYALCGSCQTREKKRERWMWHTERMSGGKKSQHNERERD